MILTYKNKTFSIHYYWEFVNLLEILHWNIDLTNKNKSKEIFEGLFDIYFYIYKLDIYLNKDSKNQIGYFNYFYYRHENNSYGLERFLQSIYNKLFNGNIDEYIN